MEHTLFEREREKKKTSFFVDYAPCRQAVFFAYLFVVFYEIDLETVLFFIKHALCGHWIGIDLNYEPWM